ncbi:MAG TPA: hypothetical protein VK582_07535 [Pyrinomonadaceae bacterium]|nr:hypothetical protein [Pyrinomonadaceae bacterium]
MNKLRMISLGIVLFLAGFLANALLAPKQVQALPPGDHIYKVVPIGDPRSGQFETNLNLAAKGGWRFVPFLTGAGVMVFEK